MGERIWEKPIAARLGKVSNFERLFVHRQKGLFLSVYVDDRKLAGKKQKFTRRGKYSTKKSIWENQHLSLIMYTWDALKTMRNKQRYCGHLQNHVRIAIFSGENREISIPSKSSYFFMVL